MSTGISAQALESDTPSAHTPGIQTLDRADRRFIDRRHADKPRILRSAGCSTVGKPSCGQTYIAKNIATLALSAFHEAAQSKISFSHDFLRRAP